MAARHVRIVSYNVLSPPLCSSSWFPKCKHANLDEGIRFSRIMEQLKVHMKTQAIVCLQEVDQLWHGKLACFFEEHDYTLVIHHYKATMGVGVAYPRARFSISSAVVERVANFIQKPAEPKGFVRNRAKVTPGAWDRKPVPVGLVGTAWATITGTASWLYTAIMPTTPAVPSAALAAIDEYEQILDAIFRHNVMLLLTLKDSVTDKEFCVATYHMPCAFTQPMVMSLHAWKLAARVQKHAENKPCILAGDFNFQPDSSCYTLMTTGSLPREDAAFAASVAKVDKQGRRHISLAKPFASALAQVHGQEPDFTNHAVNKYNAFVGTLDFAFLLNCKATDAVSLPHRDNVADAPYPSDTEPSDHALIWCDVNLEDN